MQSSVNLALSDFMQLSIQAREEILALFRKGDGITPSQTVQTETAEEETPPELTRVQVKRLLDGVAEQSKSVLRYIAEQPVEGFSLRGVHKAAGMPDTVVGLRGSWGGITKRSRGILGDPDAELIWWEDSATDPEDMVGRVSETTHRSLRKVLGIR